MPRAAVFAVLTFLYMPAPALWSQAPAQAPQASPAWLVADTAARTVTLSLDVTAPAGAPSAMIAGHRAGEVEIVAPLNWTVTWHWQSSDSTASHSLVVMAEREKLPAQGGQPALDNAMTRMVTTGLKAGQTDVTTFTADQAGWYWLLCGVPGHALKGEWLGLRVDPDAKGPEVRGKR
ncbi:MAG TPA: sulfocyanin-like copper-binding protein [Gemmatimonadales bacterium]|nr:sulfocyanin-like copper-binding protein [Gemmatimonadales bacterium]